MRFFFSLSNRLKIKENEQTHKTRENNINKLLKDLFPFICLFNRFFFPEIKKNLLKGASSLTRVKNRRLRNNFWKCVCLLLFLRFSFNISASFSIFIHYTFFIHTFFPYFAAHYLYYTYIRTWILHKFNIRSKKASYPINSGYCGGYCD